MLIGVLAVKCKEQSYLGIHRMTCRFWKELCGRQVRLPPIFESQLRARLKKIGYQLGNPPGYVLQIFPPEYLDACDQRRYDDEQSLGACLAHQAKSTGHYPRRTAWTRPRGDVE